MASPEGTRFETDVVRELVAAGLRAVKPRQTTFKDVGDVHLGDDIVVQAKNWGRVADGLREGVRGAQAQARNAGRPFGVAVIKRRGGSVRDAYVAMPLHVFASLLRSRQSP